MIYIIYYNKLSLSPTAIELDTDLNVICNM